LFRGLERWSANDPLAVLTTAMHGRTVAFAGLDGFMDYDDYYGHAIHVWDAEQQERRFEIILGRRGSELAESGGYDLTFNSDGLILVSSNANGLIQFWEMVEGKEINRIQLTQRESAQIALSPDDRFLAILSDQDVLIWDTETGEEYVTLSP
jgi:WD40 repeat protein